MEQLESVLAQWREATAPLDGKACIDATLIAPRGSSMVPRRTTSTVTTKLDDSSEALKRTNSLVVRADDAAVTAPKANANALEKSCRPCSHDDFLARAATFSIATWFAKPAVISVFECARHGWVNTSQSDELTCLCCEQFLCFQIDPKLSEQGALRVATAFAAMLSSGHLPRCPWRDNPSPEAFATLPIASVEQVRASLVQRIEQLLAACVSDRALLRAASALQLSTGVIERVLQQGKRDESAATTTATTASATLTQRVVTALAPLVDATDDRSTPLLLNAAVLSACGWQLEATSNGGDDSVMLCETCNRRWCVSSYSSSYSNSRDSDASARVAVANDADRIGDDVDDIESQERAAKRQRTAASLDPIAQHRWFCPWVSARTSEASRDTSVESDAVARFGENDAQLWAFTLRPGWQQYAQALCLLGSADTVDTTAVSTEEPSASSEASKPTRPEQALESVRAVLGLPEW